MTDVHRWGRIAAILLLAAPGAWAQGRGDRGRDLILIAPPERRPLPPPPDPDLVGPAPEAPARMLRILIRGEYRTISFDPAGPPAGPDATGLDEAEDKPARPPGQLLALDDAALERANLVLERGNVDRLVFGGDGDEAWRARRLARILASKLDQFGRSYTLTSEERAKLALAGRGDVKHFFDRVDAARLEFEARRRNFRMAIDFLPRLDPLADQYREGPFGPDSRFQKTLRTIRPDFGAHRATEGITPRG